MKHSSPVYAATFFFVEVFFSDGSMEVGTFRGFLSFLGCVRSPGMGCLAYLDIKIDTPNLDSRRTPQRSLGEAWASSKK